MMSQIVQEEAGKIIVRVVKRPDCSDNDIKILDSELRRLLGQDMTIDYKFVEDIERVGTGKYRFVLSKLDEARLYGWRNHQHDNIGDHQTRSAPLKDKDKIN